MQSIVCTPGRGRRPRPHRRARPGPVALAAVVVAGMLATLAPIAPTAASAFDATERIYLPARAPLDLRTAEREAIAADFARRVAADAEIGRDELSRWLRYHGGRLGQLLETTGLDPARLVMGAIAPVPEQAVGGPFVALDGDAGEPVPTIDMDRLVDRVLATVPLASPVVDGHRVTSGFGRRRDPFRGRAAFHRGIDLAAARGTPICAPAAGKVVAVGRRGGYGNLVELDHGNGVVTRYAHLHAYLVKRGDTVAPGERIGLMGRSGRTTGVHLHYEVLVDGRPVDPAGLLAVGRELALDGV
ncbi:MAG: peptidoglycan DD-metalloendopeptidase family protein [Alphaproteobacteria bacterium]|jgi:murein DD-endopeptidase MepM/ murein hydrolase activator NlpD|nr:peptidoglycan DD-metalloendopeptidase family protein [Alphaproteobacteria bacterium]